MMDSASRSVQFAKSQKTSIDPVTWKRHVRLPKIVELFLSLSFMFLLNLQFKDPKKSTKKEFEIFLSSVKEHEQRSRISQTRSILRDLFLLHEVARERCENEIQYFENEIMKLKWNK